MYLGEAYPLTWRVQELPPGERGAHATLRIIKATARQDAASPEIRLLAQEIVGEFVSYDDESEVRALHAFVRDEIRYTRDVYGLETVQAPRLTLRTGSGDCDDKTALLAALLLAIGHPVRYVLARTSRARPADFSHVYLETPVRGRWTALETIIPGRPVGWVAPQYGPAYRELGGPVYVSGGLQGTELSGFWKKVRKWKPGKTLKKAAPFVGAGAALFFAGPAAAGLAVKAARGVSRGVQRLDRAALPSVPSVSKLTIPPELLPGENTLPMRASSAAQAPPSSGKSSGWVLPAVGLGVLFMLSKRRQRRGR